MATNFLVSEQLHQQIHSQTSVPQFRTGLIEMINNVILVNGVYEFGNSRLRDEELCRFRNEILPIYKCYFENSFLVPITNYFVDFMNDGSFQTVLFFEREVASKTSIKSNGTMLIQSLQNELTNSLQDVVRAILGYSYDDQSMSVYYCRNHIIIRLSTLKLIPYYNESQNVRKAYQLFLIDSFKSLMEQMVTLFITKAGLSIAKHFVDIDLNKGDGCFVFTYRHNH